MKPTSSGYIDIVDSGEATNGEPKLLIMAGLIEINDFNPNLLDVFRKFCKKNNLEFAILPTKIAINTGNRDYLEFTEQLKLFYL